MKLANYLRVLILVSFVCALILACSDVDSTNTAREEVVESSHFVEVQPLSYKGHRYLWFRAKIRKGFGGVTHDPDCPHAMHKK